MKKDMIFKLYFEYFIKPKYTQNNDNINVLHKLKNIGGLYFLLLILTFLVICLNIFFTKLGYSPLIKNVGHDTFAKSHTFFVTLVSVILIGPILEEFAFRYYLRFKPITLSISFCILVYYFLPDITYLNSTRYGIFIFKVSAAIIAFISTFYLLNKSEFLRTRLNKIWEEKYRLIFYLSLLFFVFNHLKNFDINLKFFYFLPIMLLPQFIAGYSFMFVRMKYGIFYSIVLHILNNATLYLLSL